MTDGEALAELAAALDHLKEAEDLAQSQEVSKILLSSLNSLDETTQEIISELGEQHREKEEERRITDPR